MSFRCMIASESVDLTEHVSWNVLRAHNTTIVIKMFKLKGLDILFGDSLFQPRTIHSVVIKVFSYPDFRAGLASLHSVYAFPMLLLYLGPCTAVA